MLNINTGSVCSWLLTTVDKRIFAFLTNFIHRSSLPDSDSVHVLGWKLESWEKTYANYTQKGPKVDLNPGPSCWEAAVLTATPSAAQLYNTVSIELVCCLTECELHGIDTPQISENRTQTTLDCSNRLSLHWKQSGKWINRKQKLHLLLSTWAHFNINKWSS